MSEMWVQMVKPTIISVFAGGGGSSLGYKWAGFEELLAIDFDKNCCETLKANFDFPVWQRDIKGITVNEILEFCKIGKNKLDILDGSPPCQGFSISGKRIISDPRNDLFLDFVRLIEGLQPKIFVMENVPGMMKGKMKGKFNEILKDLKRTGYNVKCKLMNAMWYEVPQSRERLFFLGIRNDLRIEPSFPKPLKSFITFNESIKGIKENILPPGLSPYFLKWVSYMKAGKSVADVIKQNKCFQTKRIYGNKVCPTITKMGGSSGFGSLIHPTEDRVLSEKELLMICSFPENYKLNGTYEEKKARLGNAVMPKMMFHIAKNIKENILNKIESKECN